MLLHKHGNHYFSTNTTMDIDAFLWVVLQQFLSFELLVKERG